MQNETVESLFLDYSLVTTPKATSQFIEVQSKGEISYKGLGGTPFSPVVKPFPTSRDEPKMLEVVVSDYLLNSLLYHANRYFELLLTIFIILKYSIFFNNFLDPSFSTWFHKIG